MLVRRKPNSGSYFRNLRTLKKLFWVYFLLLIFEGALRKWIVPQLSAPLLLVRDPVAMYIIWEAYRTQRWPRRWSVVISILAVAIVGLCVMQTVVGDNPWFVGVYGLRSYLLPFPVAFIMGENLDEEDLRKFGICILWLLLPMAGLEVGQYLMPSNSFLNRGGYEGASQIAYVGAHVRAAGTFSYVVGSISFGTLGAAFIFYGLVDQGLVKQWLLWAAIFALVLSVPVIGARTLVFELGAVVGCVAMGAIMGISQFGRTLRVVLPLLVVLLLVSLLPVFSEARSSLTTRFQQADASEGGSAESSFINRSLGPIVDVIETTDFENNWLGMGMGRGAAAMSTLLNGNQDFSMGEGEFSREIAELGPLVGAMFEIFKLLLGIMIVAQALQRAREHEPLALLLLPLALPALLMSIVEQPTEQGFMVIGLAFCMAATKAPMQVPERILPLVLQRHQFIYHHRPQRG